MTARLWKLGMKNVEVRVDCPHKLLRDVKELRSPMSCTNFVKPL